MSNNIFKNILTSVNDSLQKSHENWKTEQNLIQKQENDYLNYNIQMQLQWELFEALSETTAPNSLRKLSYPDDLSFDGYNINKTGITEYYFRWEKSESYTKTFLSQTLIELQEKFNNTIYAHRERLSNKCTCRPDIYQHILDNFPLTVRGFIVTNCADDLKNPKNYIRLTVSIY